MFRLILLLLLLQSLLIAKWQFTEQDILDLNKSQLEVLNISYQVGNHYSIEENMGYTLAAIAIVENWARMKDTNNNDICGPHQVDSSENGVSCKALESNPFTSAISSLDNLENWKYQYNSKGEIVRQRSLSERIRMYNVGYTDHPHQWEYLYRVEVAAFVLEVYSHLWLNKD